MGELLTKDVSMQEGEKVIKNLNFIRLRGEWLHALPSSNADSIVS